MTAKEQYELLKPKGWRCIPPACYFLGNPRQLPDLVHPDYPGKRFSVWRAAELQRKRERVPISKNLT